jgi:hypothetical protein
MTAADLTDVRPLTDRILMLVFSDGHIDKHGYHQTSDAETAVLDPFMTNKARVLSAWNMSSPDDPVWKSSAQPTAVYRKSKGSDFSRKCKWDGKRCDNDVALEHTVYLLLPKAMKRGAHYRISYPGLAAHTSSTQVLFDEFSVRSEAVHASQIGFVPSAAKKFAYVSVWMGDGGGLDLKGYASSAFHIVRVRDGERVFSGVMTLRKGKTEPDTGADGDEGPDRNFTGADLYECDFSAFHPADSTDEYAVVVDRIGCSFPFRMSSDVYREAFRTTVRGLYHQRAGIALDAKYTDWTRPRDHHPDDGVKIWYSKYPVLAFKSESDIKQLKAARTSMVRNIWGWYHDAGDWDGYPSHLVVPRYLMTVFELKPKNFSDGELGLPESGNGRPDILDEASWLINYLRRAKGPTGGNAGARIVEDEEQKLEEGIPSWEDPRDWYASGEDPQTTFRYSSLAAQYAFCAELSGSMSESERKGWITEAEKAYKWAIRNTGPWEKETANARLLAEVWLYKTTGKQKYHEAFLASAESVRSIDPDASSPKDEQWAVWAYLTMKRPRDDATLKRFGKMALSWADDLVVKPSFGPDPSGGKGRGFRAGWHWYVPTVIGFNTTPHVMPAMIAWEMTGKPEYLDAVRTTCDYMLGGNGLNMCWVSGLGDRSPRELLNLDSWYGKRKEVIPGIVPYAVFRPDKQSGYFWNGPWHSEMNWDHMYPSKFLWPMHEGYCENRYCPMGNEYTLHQNIAPAAAAYGWLCAPRGP